MKWIKVLFNKLFRKGISLNEGALDTSSKKYKPVDRMKNLQTQLNEINTGYTKKFKEIEKQYFACSLEFETEYRKNPSRDELQPLETRLNELKGELNTIHQYQQEEVLQLVQTMDSLSKEYLQSKAEQIHDIAEVLQEMKQQYLNKITELGNVFKEVTEIESTIKNTYRENGHHYKDGALTRSLSHLTVGEPVQIEQIAVSPYEVNAGITGNRIYTV